MKVTSNETVATVTRSFTITEDGPVHPMEYSLTGKQVKVEGGTIEYHWTPEGWAVRNAYAISLRCTVLKKDGTESLLTHSRKPGVTPNNHREPTLVLHQSYAWLARVVDLLRPEGDSTMAALDDAEVTG